MPKKVTARIPPEEIPDSVGWGKKKKHQLRGQLASMTKKRKDVPKKILMAQKISASRRNFSRIVIFYKFIFFSGNLKMWLKEK